MIDEKEPDKMKEQSKSVVGSTMAVISAEYHPSVFANLPDFPEAKAALDRQREKIALLGDVICGWELHEQLGVNLLHKHFELFNNEQMVKRRDLEKNEAYVTPVAIDQDRKPYFYQATLAAGEFVFEPLEFFKIGEAEQIPTLAEIIDGKEEFLEEFAARSFELEVNRVFGLAILHEQFVTITEEEIRLETTDSERRILTIGAVNRSDVNLTDVTETVWSFTLPSCEPGSNDVYSPSNCWAHCKNHCDFHCQSHCEAHCTSHCKNH